MALSDSNGCFLCLNENVDWLDYQSSAVALLFFSVLKINTGLAFQAFFEHDIYYIVVPLNVFLEKNNYSVFGFPNQVH